MGFLWKVLQNFNELMGRVIAGPVFLYIIVGYDQI